MPNIKLHEYDLPMEPGDYLLMHTDGVTETFNPAGTIFGEQRYKKLLQRYSTLSVRGKMLQKIEVELTRFRGTSALGDDTTLLAIRRIPLLAELKLGFPASSRLVPRPILRQHLPMMFASRSPHRSTGN